MEFGPIALWPAFAEFDALGNKVHDLFHELLKQAKAPQLWHQIYWRMAFQARSTSTAIRLNNSYGFTLQAFSLLRVRLEQAIVCSYLIHEEPAKGIYPFMVYTTIKGHKNQEAAFEIPAVKEELKQFDSAVSRAAAEAAQKVLKPEFNPSTDAFQREWTNLDLRSMAKKRDAMVKQAGGHKFGPLENDYLIIYKTASSVIHSDCASYSSDFLEFVDVEGQQTLIPAVFWGFTSASLSSFYDMLQFYEILRFLKVECQDQFKELNDEFLKLRDKHLPDFPATKK